MSTGGEDEGTSEGEAVAVETAPEAVSGEPTKLDLTVEIETVGPCRKHVAVTVPESDLEMLRNDSLDEFADQAEVPGFRIGRVPRSLLQKRFKSELSDQVKQKVLLQSLEQMSEENDIDPINQPDIDIESLDIPDSGDFRYEFDVEVRPEFEVPDYKGFTIDRPSSEVSDEEFQACKEEFLESYSQPKKVDRAAAPGDSVFCDILFTHNGKEIRESKGVPLRLRPTLRFQDAVLEDFDKLMTGCSAGDDKSAEVTISVQSPIVEMRNETANITFTVKEVREHVRPSLDREFLDQFDCDDEKDLDEFIRTKLLRQIEFHQRQTAREQVLEKITDSADWDLPESLVKQQTENALRREILEMNQAGFTREQVAARENEIRQNAIETTRTALKEHFVLDRIATSEEIECEPEDIDRELMLMAMQSGEPQRRIRARMVKSGMMDNMEAQLRERKAVDFILEHASFNEVEREPLAQNTVTAASFAICGNMTSSLIDDAADA
ncbi:trigger factor [Fuerstiella marisgermanici]|uniref:Trigger factor n=1 Tax=Fuerstiella marisgermanici TaxID=1891926 RepID=A0A1P8WJK3_9PLAN|nr:trigger factor [Fuerstiella marisgermanici]APZ94240.1 Trigger factor [Fuerstiella marisgermanici]